MRRLPIVLAIVMTTIVGIGVNQLSFRYFLSEELLKAEGRLSLYRSSVVAELERYAHLTHVLARDTFVIDTAQGANTATLNQRLEGFADQAGLDAIYLMAPDGLTVAASNYRQPTSFVGQTYSFRPYFQQAMMGEQGRFYAIGATTGLPGYFIADPVHDSAGAISGVIALKLNLSQLENSWRQSGEQVILANEDGVVLLASDPAWRYQTLVPLSDEKKASIREARQFPGQPLNPLDWVGIADQRVRIAGNERLHLATSDLPHGWELHYFTSDDRAVVRSWLVTAAVVVAAGLLLSLFLFQRARRIGAALARSEQEEAELRRANEQLAVEISERRTAERRLKRTQGELERASRLAALGQLAASVTHELGQPIAAMRNHLAAAEMGATQTPALTGPIGSLVDRMEGITRQLKFFARSDKEKFEEVDLGAAMQVSLTLLAPNIEHTGCKVGFDLPPEPITIRGSRLRIEQVMTNLLRNAIDAVEEATNPQVDVRMGKTASDAWFEIRDNGHGLGERTLSEIQEPFVTTRESGRGMGLGLAISANIIKDHEGTMTARNAETGGAVFHVSIPVSLDQDE